MTHREQVSNPMPQSHQPNNALSYHPKLNDNLAQITMDALSAQIAIFTQDGTIIAVNEAWRDFARQNGTDPATVSEGTNYLEACKHAADAGSSAMQSFMNNIHELFANKINDFACEYPCHSPTEQRWFVAKVTRFVQSDQIFAVVAHENITAVKLVQETQRAQRIFAEALLDITTLINSTLDYEIVLERILSNLERVIPYDRANIIVINDGEVRVIGADEAQLYAKDITDSDSLQTLVNGCECKIVYPTDKVSGEGNGVHIGIPILSGEQVIGVINLEQDQGKHINDEAIEHLKAFANHAAIAIKNAQIYQKSQEMAAIEERQRLARELHDAVTQTLFSADLMAQTLPYLWNKNPERVGSVAEELHELTASALAEMRTLLLELRPSVLVQTSLQELVKQLTQAFNGRSRIPVQVNIDLIPEIPYDTKVVFYRITQEALNNIQQHTSATATQVYVDLTYNKDILTLIISDDGNGFDASDDLYNHHGLKIMIERAQSIQAQLDIASSPNSGTTISLYWNKNAKG